MTRTLRIGLAAAAVALLGAAAVGLAARAAGEPASAAAEGIQVHGHWEIEVHDPDGTLARRVEFENALTASGPAAITGLLSGLETKREWIVELVGASPDEMPCFYVEPRGCVAKERSSDVPFVFDTLTVVPGATLELNGEVVAARTGNIAHVVTRVHWLCAPERDPAECGGSNGIRDVTAHALETPAPVVEGQHVVVRVTLSFS